MKKAERNTIQKQAKEFVKRYIDSHEPDTFVYNEHGIMLYKAGYSTINLESFFEDIIEDFISELPDTSQQLAEREKVITTQAEEIKKLKEGVSKGLEAMKELNGEYQSGWDEEIQILISLLTPKEEESKEGVCGCNKDKYQCCVKCEPNLH